MIVTCCQLPWQKRATRASRVHTHETFNWNQAITTPSHKSARPLYGPKFNLYEQVVRLSVYLSLWNRMMVQVVRLTPHCRRREFHENKLRGVFLTTATRRAQETLIKYLFLYYWFTWYSSICVFRSNFYPKFLHMSMHGIVLTRAQPHGSIGSSAAIYTVTPAFKERPGKRVFLNNSWINPIHDMPKRYYVQRQHIINSVRLFFVLETIPNWR